VNACVHTFTKPQTSSTRSRGLGRRIHGSVEDTKLSTNKQHSLSLLACRRALSRPCIHRELARGRTGLAALACRSRVEGGLACSARALPRAGQLVTVVHAVSCPATSCPALGIACALHGPRIRAGRDSALTPHLHDICQRVSRFSAPLAAPLEPLLRASRRKKTRRVYREVQVK
jgi:hypothetical protein